MRNALWITLFGIALPVVAVLATETVRADDAPDTAAVQALIEQLGADDFQTREAASRKLEALGQAARPALEAALKGEPTPEVRWRAEQILRRLKGGDQERPLGGDTPRPQQDEARPAPGGLPIPGGLRGGEMGEAMKRMQEMLEAWRKDGSALGNMLGVRRLTAPGLVLQRSLLGNVMLRVTRERSDGTRVEDVFHGASLEDILADHPELADHAGMEELKRREAEADWPGLEDFRKQLGGLGVAPFPNGGFSMAMGSGVEIRQDADGATVKIRERDENGKEVVKEYKGATLDEIKEQHPEIADKLGGFSVRLMPPQVFWPGTRPRHLEPLQPRTPVTPRSRPVGKAVFGLTLTDVSPALASQLGLEAGRGALVDNVFPGSQAEAMGVRRHDIVLEVDGQGVGLAEASDLLRKAGAEKAPLEIVLLRRGERLTLGR